jgi:hypothetical protein
MKLRRFNSDGVMALVTYRSRLALEPNLTPPIQTLEDPALTEEIPGAIEVPKRGFETRLDAGRFLNELLEHSGITLPENDRGLWSWLTMFYFDELCPADGNGNRDPKGEERLIPLLDNYQRFYRHLLVGPFLIVRAHRDKPERAIAMLCNPIWQPGEIAGQLAASKELVTNRGVVELATRLYYDVERKSFKRGAGSKTRGAPRRLADLLNQLDLTFYLYGMSADELLGLLPKEFDRFRVAS